MLEKVKGVSIVLCLTPQKNFKIFKCSANAAQKFFPFFVYDVHNEILRVSYRSLNCLRYFLVMILFFDYRMGIIFFGDALSVM